MAKQVEGIIYTEEADIYYVDCKPYIRQSVNQLKTEKKEGV